MKQKVDETRRIDPIRTWIEVLGVVTLFLGALVFPVVAIALAVILLLRAGGLFNLYVEETGLLAAIYLVVAALLLPEGHYGLMVVAFLPVIIPKLGMIIHDRLPITVWTIEWALQTPPLYSWGVFLFLIMVLASR